MTILFNKQFYRLQAIKKAIEAYKELAVFNIKEKDNNITMNIYKIYKNVIYIMKYEFCK